MKVLWLRPSTGENVSVRRERIAEHLEEMGVDVTIRDASGMDALGAVKEVLLGKYDIICGNVRSGLYLGYPLARLLRKPFLGDVSDPITDIETLPPLLYKLFAKYEWFVLRHSDAAVFVYESSYNDALDQGIDAYRLPNAVNYEEFRNPSNEVINETEKILHGEGMNMDSYIAVYTGILDDVHHISDIIESARQNPDWAYLLVGEGPLSSDVAATANELTNVYFPGSFEHRLMPGFLYHADAGFCFKDAEQTLKLKEYAAASLPTLTQPGELQNWFSEDELVFVEPKPEIIAKALQEIENVEITEEYARNIHDAVEFRTWKEIADSYHHIFQEIS
jgi:glycosyltransferase involved in cell wall biosynthesis